MKPSDGAAGMNEYRPIPMAPLGAKVPIGDENSSVHPSLVRRNTENELHKSPDKYVMYRERWLILATCCVLALSNSMQWMSYITLSAQTNIFYCQEATANATCYAGFYTNQIFQCVAVITGLGGMYITDHYGIRLSINCGVGLNLAGSLIRLLSSVPLIQNAIARQVLLHLGSVIVAGAQAFFLVLPSKIAECWFAENQRALANVLSFIANPFGVAFGTMVPTLIFRNLGVTMDSSFRSTWYLFGFNAIMSGMACANAIMAFCLRRDVPKTSPSPSNAIHAVHKLGFWSSIKSCFMEKQFVLQMFTFAVAFAQLWGFMIILPEIMSLQTYKYDGEAGAICAFVGVLASLFAGYICDQKKCFKEIIKFCSIFFAVTAVIFRIYLIHPKGGLYDEVVILILCSFLGAFSIPQFPIGVEMGVETTFPVFEATSSGLLVLSGQLCMFAFSFIFWVSRQSNIIYTVAQESAVGNWQLALDIWCVICIAAAAIAYFFLNPHYKRVAFEQQSALEKEQENGKEEGANR